MLFRHEKKFHDKYETIELIKKQAMHEKNHNSAHLLGCVRVSAFDKKETITRKVSHLFAEQRGQKQERTKKKKKTNQQNKTKQNKPEKKERKRNKSTKEPSTTLFRLPSSKIERRKEIRPAGPENSI